MTTAAITAEMDFAGAVELARRLVKNATASLGKARGDDAQTARLRGQLAVAERKLEGATPRTFRAICDAINPVAQEVLTLQAARGRVIDVRGDRTGVPEVRGLDDVSARRGTPTRTLLRWGFIIEYPLVGAYRSPRGRRYQSTVPGCWVILWDRSTWSDPEVEAIRQAIIRTAGETLSALSYR
jgi:hypothetical protein